MKNPMEIVVIAILLIATICILLRRFSNRNKEKKSVEWVAIIPLGVAVVCILLRRFGI